MSKTSLLPPATAVQTVWARTSEFSTDKQNRNLDILTMVTLKNIIERAEKDDKERSYITRAFIAMDTSLRSIHTIYKGRELNFKDTDKLRDATLEAVKSYSQFGKELKDYLKPLPLALTIGTGGGVTLVYVTDFFGKNISNVVLLFVSLLFAGIGIFAYMLFVRYLGWKKKRLFIQQDYERSLYYRYYLNRVENILKSLYQELNQIHKEVFGQTYPSEDDDEKTISNMIEDSQPKFCDYTDKHFWEKGKFRIFKRITPERWPLCETGDKEILGMCPFWKGLKNQEKKV